MKFLSAIAEFFQIKSTAPQGTSPLVVQSTTKVDNLNSDMLNGKRDTDFATSSHSHNINNLSGDLLANRIGEPQYVKYGATKTAKPLYDVLRGDRTAFLPPDQIIIEQSTDAGVTWVDAGVSDSNKTRLFTGQRPSILLPLKNGVKNTDCMMRITITGMKYNVPAGTPETAKYNYWNKNYVLSTERYFTPENMWCWVSSNTDSIYCLVERATGNDSVTWYKDGEGYLGGWSAGNNMCLSGNTLGGGTDQIYNYWNWRFTFRTCSNNHTFVNSDLATSYTTSYQAIHHIKISSSNVWVTPNTYMYNDHLYSWNENQEAYFPSNIYSRGYKVSLEGHTHGYLPTTGGTMTGAIYTPNAARGIYVGDDASIGDVNLSNHIGLWGQQDQTMGGITFGSGNDTNIYRGGANLLKTDDVFNAVGGFQWNGQSLDSRYAPAGYGLGTSGLNIAGQDLNNILNSGFYVGNSLGNAPDSDWYYIIVVGHPDQNWCSQIIISYGAAGVTRNAMHSRVKVSGAWTSWQRILNVNDIYTHPSSHPASMITGLATIATSGSYNDLSNKPTSLPANGGNSDTVDNLHASDIVTEARKWAGKTTFIAYPADGAFVTQVGNVTGYLKITLPRSWSNTMLRFDIDIYNYATSSSVTYTVGGYIYTGNSAWINNFAYCNSNRYSPYKNLNVRFGHDGSKCAVYIGESTTGWVYPQVSVKNITLGYSNNDSGSWNTGWSVDFTTTLGTITSTISETNAALVTPVEIGAAPASHTHTKSQITDFPTSLPANGGNADTVGGQSASSFAPSTHTHTKSQITDFPTSLPANGGNADTVGGIAASKLLRNDITSTQILSTIAAGCGNEIWGTSDSSALYINYRSYDGTTNNYMTTVIGDGKGENKLTIDGESGAVLTCRGNYLDDGKGNTSATGNAAIGGTVSVGNKLIVKQGSDKGIWFPNDSFGGSGDTASITLQNPNGGEAAEMTFTMANDADDIVHFKVPSNNGVKINNNVVWNAGNMGSGSGLIADLLDGKHASDFTKRVDLTAQCQTTSYRRSVIALCETSGANTGLNSYSIGTITFHRNNGLTAPVKAEIAIECQYSGDGYINASIINTWGDKNSIRACTFTYNGKKYGGIEFFFEAAEHTVVEFSGSTNFPIFALDYYDTQNSAALNTEVNSSLSFSSVSNGSSKLSFNNNFIYHEGNKPTLAEIGAAPTTHTHTKSQITDFPTSLPANGGNADTVGGQSASSFAPSGFGLGSTCAYVPYDDVHKITGTGWYMGSTTANSPAANTWFIYEAIVQGADWSLIKAYDFTSNPCKIYYKQKTNGTWTGWRTQSCSDYPIIKHDNGKYYYLRVDSQGMYLQEI